MPVANFFRDVFHVAVGAVAFVAFSVAMLILGLCRWVTGSQDDD